MEPVGLADENIELSISCIRWLSTHHELQLNAQKLTFVISFRISSHLIEVHMKLNIQ